jgi:hypothetical protein
VLGDQSKALKTISRGKGWNPDEIVDPKTGATTPIDSGLAGDFTIFTNQGVPMTRGKYPQLADGYDVSIGAGEPATTFNSPKHRSETINAPFPGKHGDPHAGMGGM